MRETQEASEEQDEQHGKLHRLDMKINVSCQQAEHERQ
jgi:hypothetical protein